MDAVTRRAFLHQAGTGLVSAAALSLALGRGAAARSAAPPNVLLIITDDQGYGDLGRHGNPILKTPHLDRLHDESLRLTQFSVCPVCSPTRACLMTGRYNYRTGVIDTYAGRSMLDPSETTLAQALNAAGYATGIFGKWHLGDNYPLRPMDRGFEESLVHLGGGIAQPSDPEFYERENTYFDPVLQRNGAPRKTSGYCTDIFTDAALDFMANQKGRPFFTYVSYNAPHTPLQTPEEDAAPYIAAGLDEKTARVYGMIANVDRNIGRLMAFLEKAGLAENTLTLFMTDNGAQDLGVQDRFNAGLRGWKGSVYEGGLRAPCFIRWPAAFSGGVEVDRIAAHIDVMPTLLDACGVSTAERPEFDGVSLLPLLCSQPASQPPPDRTLFFQWHRGDVPEPFKNSAVRTQRWKLVNGVELYDLSVDPGETQDLAGEAPDIAARLRADYERWFADVGSTRGYDPVRVRVGNDRHNPMTLTRQDWRGEDNWMSDKIGYWEVFVDVEGVYDVSVDFKPVDAPGELVVALGGAAARTAVSPGASNVRLEGLRPVAGAARLECRLELAAEQRGVRRVTLYRR